MTILYLVKFSRKMSALGARPLSAERERTNMEGVLAARAGWANDAPMTSAASRTRNGAIAATVAASSQLSQLKVLVPIPAHCVRASATTPERLAEGAARRADRPLAPWKQRATESNKYLSCNTATTTNCDNERAAGKPRTREAVCAGRDDCTASGRTCGCGGRNIQAAAHEVGQTLYRIGAAAAAPKFPKDKP